MGVKEMFGWMAAAIAALVDVWLVAKLAFHLKRGERDIFRKRGTWKCSAPKCGWEWEYFGFGVWVGPMDIEPRVMTSKEFRDEYWTCYPKMEHVGK